MGEPVPHGYPKDLEPVLNDGGSVENEPASNRESDGTDNPLAERLTDIFKLTPSSTPFNSEHEKKNDLESGPDSFAIHTNETEANRKEANQEIILREGNEEESDPNIVGWDGLDDPANPINWSERAKWSNVMVVSMITFIS